jgi:FimV-like protein
MRAAFSFFFIAIVAWAVIGPVDVRADPLGAGAAGPLGVDAPAESATALADAERLIAKGQSADALDLLLPLEPLLAGSPDYDYLLGLAALQTGQHSLAISALERVTLVQPAHAGAWLDLAVAYRASGDPRSARRLLEHVQATFTADRNEAARVAALQRSLYGDSLLSGWRGQVDVLGGYVDNANLGIGVSGFNLTLGGGGILPVLVGPASRPRSDGALQVRGIAQRLLVHADGNTTQLGLGGRFRTYLSESDFAFGDVAASATHLRPLAGRSDMAWQMGGYVRGLYNQGEVLGVFGALQGGLRWTAGRCALGATLELERREYVASGQFSANLLWAGGQADCAINERHSLAATLRGGRDTPEGKRPGGDTQRGEASLAWRWAITPRVSSELLLYAAYNADRGGFSALLDDNQRRNLLRTGQRLVLEWRQPFGLDRRFSGLLELENIHEDSNLPVFVFRDHQVFVGLRYGF